MDFINKGLLNAISYAFKEYSEREFLVLQLPDNTFLQKKYSEFENDVQTLLDYIHTHPSHDLITINANNYIHLVQILACLLSGKTLTLISPDDSPIQMRKKLKALPANSILLDNEVCVSTIQTASLRKGRIDYLSCRIASPAIQVFTSGSTGYGKVVCLNEKNILANIQAVSIHHRLSHTEIIATSLPLFHVNCLFFSFLSSFLNGGKLVLFEKFDISCFSEAIARERVTIVSVVPTLLTLLCRSAKLIDKKDFATVKYFVSAASYLSPELLKKFVGLFDKKIMQGYGLSEIVNFSLKMPRPDEMTDEVYWNIAIDRSNTCVGVPLPYNQVQILDANHKDCGAGQVGEICIRGESVMLGYLNDKDRKAFYNDFFCTGDLGYYKQFSDILYFYVAGRKKDIIKRGGTTVSLKEVDSLLSQLNLGQIDSISIGIESEIYGEEVAMVLQISSDFLIRSVTKTLRDFLETHFSLDSRPKVVLLTTSEIRSPSGKPMRHLFKDKFGKKPINYHSLEIINELITN